MKKLITVFLWVCVMEFDAQSPIFDQANASLLQINPSYAGSNGGFRAQSSYRQEGQFNFMGSLALDAYVKPMNGGVFLSALHNEEFRKIFTTDQINFGYAQRVSILDDEFTIVPSFKLTWEQKQISQTFFSSSSLGSSPNIKQELVFLTYGILFHYKSNYTVGMSIQNIHQPDFGLLPNETEKTNRILRLQAAYTFHFSGKRLLQVMSIYSSQVAETDYSFQANYVQNHLILGLGARQYSSYSAFLGYRGHRFVIQGSYSEQRYRLIGNVIRTFEIHLSANIRDAAHQHVFTNFENW